MSATVASVVSLLLLAIVVAGAALAFFAASTARRVEATLPPLGEFIDVAGGRIHYVDKGSGPPIVMIHGLGGTLHHFTYAMMDRLVGEFRVVIIDRPGSGYSTRAPGTSARLGVQAEAVGDVIRALHLRRPLLVGHSLGGALALTVALDHPELVGGLALIAPLTQVVDEPPAVFARLAITSPTVRRLVAWTVAIPLAIRGRHRLLGAIFAPDAVLPDFPTRGGGMLGMRPDAFAATSADLVAVNDDLPGMVARYRTLNIPVGILHGRQDGILESRLHAEVMREIGENVTVELIEGGHMIPLTAPEQAVSLVRTVAQRIR